MATSEQYDSSWDLQETDAGKQARSEEAFGKIYAEWEQRKWKFWLRDHLTFPFEVKRMEDNDDTLFTDIAEHNPFRLGHTMQVVGVENEHQLFGIVVRVKEENKIGRVPLCDLEVTSKEDPNFWPVREYVVWFANR